MTPRKHLGEFQELVLLVVAIEHGRAYGVSVMDEIKVQTGRTANISAVHAALRRLETKGYVTSEWSQANAARGGRRKRLFSLTESGGRILQEVKDQRNRLWDRIPNIALKLR